MELPNALYHMHMYLWKESKLIFNLRGKKITSWSITLHYRHSSKGSISANRCTGGNTVCSCPSQPPQSQPLLLISWVSSWMYSMPIQAKVQAQTLFSLHPLLVIFQSHLSQWTICLGNQSTPAHRKQPHFPVLCTIPSCHLFSTASKDGPWGCFHFFAHTELPWWTSACVFLCMCVNVPHRCPGVEFPGQDTAHFKKNL